MAQQIPFEHLWIITRYSGICIFEAKSGARESTIDTDMMCGFLAALLSFGHEVADSNVQGVDFGNLHLLFSFLPAVVVVLGVEPGAKEAAARQMLQAIATEFQEGFGNVIASTWSGNVGDFSSFAASLNTITDESAAVDSESPSALLGKKLDFEGLKDKIQEGRSPLQQLMAEKVKLLKDLLDRSTTA